MIKEPHFYHIFFNFLKNSLNSLKKKILKKSFNVFNELEKTFAIQGEFLTVGSPASMAKMRACDSSLRATKIFAYTLAYSQN